MKLFNIFSWSFQSNRITNCILPTALIIITMFYVLCSMFSQLLSQSSISQVEVTIYFLTLKFNTKLLTK